VIRERYILATVVFFAVGNSATLLAASSAASQQVATSRPAAASQPTTLPAASQPVLPRHVQLVNEVAQAYLKAQAALARNDLAAARQAMPTVMQSGNAIYEVRPGMAPLLSHIGTQAARANDSGDLAAFRDAFGALSPAVIELVKRIPPTPARQILSMPPTADAQEGLAADRKENPKPLRPEHAAVRYAQERQSCPRAAKDSR